MLFLPKLRSEEVSVVHLAKLRFVNQTNPASNAADPHDFFIGFLGTKKPTAQKHRMKKSNLPSAVHCAMPHLRSSRVFLFRNVASSSRSVRNSLEDSQATENNSVQLKFSSGDVRFPRSAADTRGLDGIVADSSV